MQVNYPPNNFTFFGQQPGQPGGVLPSGTPATIPTLAAPDVNQFTDMMPLQQRQEMAAQALQEGSSMAPAQGGFATGLARLAAAIGGGMQLHNINKNIQSAKQHNQQIMLDAINSGDWAKLATSDNDQANKLGDSLLQAQLKHMQTERLLTPPEIDAAGLPTGTVASKNMNGEVKILNRPNAGLPKGYRYNAEGTGVEFIPGGPADPAFAQSLAGAKRAPKTAKPDDSGVPPWERKWQ